MESMLLCWVDVQLMDLEHIDAAAETRDVLVSAVVLVGHGFG